MSGALRCAGPSPDKTSDRPGDVAPRFRIILHGKTPFLVQGNDRGEPGEGVLGPLCRADGILETLPTVLSGRP